MNWRGAPTFGARPTGPAVGFRSRTYQPARCARIFVRPSCGRRRGGDDWSSPRALARRPWAPNSGRLDELKTRKPRLSLRLPGEFLFRLAERRLPASLFHDPPRFTRFEPVSSPHLPWASRTTSDASRQCPGASPSPFDWPLILCTSRRRMYPRPSSDPDCEPHE